MEFNFLKSVRIKLFLTLSLLICVIILFFIVINSAVLETLYYRAKYFSMVTAYETVNEIDFSNENKGYELGFEKMSAENNFELLVYNNDEVKYMTTKDYSRDFGNVYDINYNVRYSIFNKSDIMYSDTNVSIRKITDKKTGFDFILLKAALNSGDELMIRTSITPLIKNVTTSNKAIALIGLIAIVVGGFSVVFVTERFTKPIEELKDITNEMANLDFKKKYRLKDKQDEIDELGKNINVLSDKLEETINQLQKNNSELERDIEEKSKIDEMRKQFISDVSHELKTPIALIQGYAEGLVDGVVQEDEDKKYYLEVILDEANKMDKLVKRLLELMKLEYDERKFNDQKFDLIEVINGVIKNSKVMLQDEKIEVDFKEDSPIYVFADDFYIEQVITNYFTNAIKNNVAKNGKKIIKITVKKTNDSSKYRVYVYNTGDSISQENLNRIWTRFYKVDSARTREKGGTGIGLALVKAIMNKYNWAYGVKNKKDGVEFYFDIQEAK